MSWRRPALAAVLVLLLAAALVGPALAAAIISDELSEWIDTSGSVSPAYYTSGSSGPASVNGIEIKDIGLASYICYIVVDTTVSVSIDEGTHAYNYGFSSGTYPYSGSCDVTKIRNLAGQITATRITFWFPEWHTEGRQGKQTIYFDHPLWTESKFGCRPSGSAQFRLWDGTPVGGAEDPKYLTSGYTITYLTGILWQNDISVHPITVAGNTIGGYKIYVTRNHSEYHSKSTLKAFNADGTITYDDTSTVDTVTNLLASEISRFQIISPAKTYNYTLAADAPPSNSAFSLSLSPQTAPIGEPVTATLTAAADAPAYDYLNWQFFPDPAGGERTYRKIDGTWKLYNPGTDAYDLPGTDALNPQFTPTEAGIQNIAVQVYDLAGKKKLADLVKQFEVSESAGTMFPVDVSVFDADTGGGLLNVNLHVTNLQTGATTPITIQTQSVGYRLLLDVGSTYTVAVSKSGYESRTFRVDSTTRTLTARLPKSASPSNPDQVWLYFYALDGSQAPISGAAVQLSGLSTTLTNSQGLAKIAVTTNTTYQYTVSKADYTGVSDEIIIESVSQWKYVTLTPTGTAVTSPVPTGPGTVTTPDYRSIDEKATSALSILFDHVELFAALAGLVLLCNMLFWIVPGGKR